MDNSIQRINYVPQVKQANRKERNSDRKDDKKGEQEFSEYVSAGDGDGKNKKLNKDEPDQKSLGKGVEGKEDLLKANALNESCGTIIDFEV